MEIYLIKEIERPRKIIQDYFFNYTDKLAYNEKMAYFISNSLAEKEYNPNSYFDLPFKIFEQLYHSTQVPLTKITNTISIPKKIWNQKYFSEAGIDSINQKKEIFILINQKIDSFLEQYQKDKRITIENITELREGKDEEIICKKLKLYSNNYLYLSSVSEFIQVDEEFEIGDEVSYYELLIDFLQKSINLSKAMKASDIENYDYFVNEDEIDEIKSILHYRVHITKFYAGSILKFILDDIGKVICCYLRDVMG